MCWKFSCNPPVAPVAPAAPAAPTPPNALDNIAAAAAFSALSAAGVAAIEAVIEDVIAAATLPSSPPAPAAASGVLALDVLPLSPRTLTRSPAVSAVPAMLALTHSFVPGTAITMLDTRPGVGIFSGWLPPPWRLRGAAAGRCEDEDEARNFKCKEEEDG